MAESPAQPAPSPTTPAQIGTPEIAAAEVQMEQARAAATEQARVANDTGVDPSVNQRPAPASPATPPEPRREPSETSDQADDAEADAPEDGTDPSVTPDPNLPPEQRYSRKDAPRLAAQLEEMSKTTTELRTKLGERERTDTAALVQFANLVKTPDEYAALQRRAIDGDWEAKQTIEVADAWRQMAGPVFQFAQRQADDYVNRVEQAYKADHHKLTTLEGVDDSVLQRFTASKTPAESLRVLYDAGRAAERNEAKGRVTALETEVADLRRQLTAKGPQPMGSNGSSHAPGSLASLVRADGTIDEATIERAMRGELVGVGVEKPK